MSIPHGQLNVAFCTVPSTAPAVPVPANAETNPDRKNKASPQTQIKIQVAP